MASEDVSALGDERNAGTEPGGGAGAGDFTYEDVNLDLTAGYKPTIVVNVLVAVSILSSPTLVASAAGR